MLLNPYRFGVAVFDPLSFSPEGWFDASDAASVTVSSGKASQWNDKSGNGRHATQATSGLRFTYSTAAINGLNAMTSTGGCYMDFAGTSPNAQGWAFIVGGNSKAGPYGTIFLCSAGTGGSDYVGALESTGSIVYNNMNGNVKPLTLTGGNVAKKSDGSINVFGIWHDGTNFNPFFNNDTDVLSGSGAVSHNSLCHYLEGGTDYTLGGTFCEVFFGNGVLTSTQAANAIAYLQAKWGI